MSNLRISLIFLSSSRNGVGFWKFRNIVVSNGQGDMVILLSFIPVFLPLAAGIGRCRDNIGRREDPNWVQHANRACFYRPYLYRINRAIPEIEVNNPDLDMQIPYLGSSIQRL